MLLLSFWQIPFVGEASLHVFVTFSALISEFGTWFHIHDRHPPLFKSAGQLGTASEPTGDCGENDRLTVPL